MEKYEVGDLLNWPTLIEYFTKRGRPLTQEEKEALIKEDEQRDEDERMQEEEKLREEEKLISETRMDAFGQIQESEGREGKEVRFREDTEFKDSLNDRDLAYSGARQRNRSANREDLSQIELSNKDFRHYEKTFKKRSRSTAKEYKITVPRTFNFEKRVYMKPKTIREWKIEKMIEEKKLEEEMSHKHFKASRPPPEVLIPQYKNIVEKEKRRRQEVKETSMAKTKANERLFEFYKREERKKQLKEEIKKEEKEFKHKFKARNVPVE
jgi:hypothetical protein